MSVEAMALEDIPLPKQLRLRSIEVLIDGYGYVNREVLAEIHGLQVAAIARDLALYRKLNPNSVYYNQSTRRIEKLSNFQRLFK